MISKDAVVVRSYQGQQSGLQFVELKGIEFGYVDVTPEMAFEWLANKNTKNRHARLKKVADFTRDMTNDAWMVNGESVIFDEDGVLVDGQHRLTAIVESNTNQYLLVVWGTKPESRATVDTGAARALADQLKILGRGQWEANALSAVAARLHMVKSGKGVSARYAEITHSEGLAFIDQMGVPLERAAEISLRVRKLGLSISPAGTGAAYYLCAEKDVNDAEDFIVTQFVEGIGLQPGSPALALRQKIDVNRTLTRRSMEANEAVCYIISAWNRFRSGDKDVVRIAAPKGGWKTYPTPV